MTVETAKENVRQSVVVIIAHRDPGTVFENAIHGPLLLAQVIREEEAGCEGREQGETGLALGGEQEGWLSEIPVPRASSSRPLPLQRSG